ncbi:MAG: O-antigen ligase family protein [bacterium]
MKLTRHGVHDQVFNFGCAALVFFMPIHPRVLPPVILIMVLNWIIDGRFITRIPRIFTERRRFLTFCFSALYLLYLIGLLYTKNMTYAWFDLEVKLSLFIFPFLFATSDLTFERGNLAARRIAAIIYCLLLFVTTWLQRTEYGILFFGILTWIILFGIAFIFSDILFPCFTVRKQVIATFVAGCFVGTLILLMHAAANYFYLDDKGAFYYKPLGWFFHPSYISMYLNFAAAAVTLELLNRKEETGMWAKIGMALLVLYFVVLIFLLGSKSGLIVMATLALLLAVFMVLVRKRFVRGMIILVASAVVFYGGIKLFSYTAERVNLSLGDLENTKGKGVQTDNSIGTRLEIWEDSWQIIRENWLIGVGTGDVKDVLLEKYKNDHFLIGYEDRRNAHEQYLQTFIVLGIVGFLTLFAMIIIPAIYALREKYYLYLIFLLIFAINIMVESMLENQAGVIFYAFFNVFLFSKRKAIPGDDLSESK